MSRVLSAGATSLKADTSCSLFRQISGYIYLYKNADVVELGVKCMSLNMVKSPWFREIVKSIFHQNLSLKKKNYSPLAPHHK